MNIPHDTRARLGMLNRQTATRPPKKDAGEARESATKPASDKPSGEATVRASTSTGAQQPPR